MPDPIPISIWKTTKDSLRFSDAQSFHAWLDAAAGAGGRGQGRDVWKVIVVASHLETIQARARELPAVQVLVVFPRGMALPEDGGSTLPPSDAHAVANPVEGIFEHVVRQEDEKSSEELQSGSARANIRPFAAVMCESTTPSISPASTSAPCPLATIIIIEFLVLTCEHGPSVLETDADRDRGDLLWPKLREIYGDVRDLYELVHQYRVGHIDTLLLWVPPRTILPQLLTRLVTYILHALDPITLQVDISIDERLSALIGDVFKALHSCSILVVLLLLEKEERRSDEDFRSTIENKSTSTRIYAHVDSTISRSLRLELETHMSTTSLPPRITVAESPYHSFTAYCV